jgi:antitoxin component YwqK of YwqJK toxin-antitoxin module
MKLIHLCFFLCFNNFCNAQSDTTIIYVSKEGQLTSKDSAYSFVRFFKQNNLWHGMDYYIKNSLLKSEGNYADKNLNTPVGKFNNYSVTGKLDFTASYNNGKPVEATYYYPSGKKKSIVIFDEKGPKEQKGWDESGKEIKNYVVMSDATFKGGTEKWKKYLEKNVDGNVAVDAGAPVGEYTVEVTFKVSSQGNIINAKTKSVPTLCKPCGKEAIRVVLNSPEWQPAIRQNEPVDFLVSQSITFVVSEVKKKK